MPTVLARLRLTRIHNVLAVAASVAWPADALVVTGFLNAVKCVAWVAVVGLTLIYISLTTLACKAWWAAATVTTHSVHARPIVEAFGDTAIRIQGTVILIYFTQDT